VSEVGASLVHEKEIGSAWGGQRQEQSEDLIPCHKDQEAYLVLE
jgi:hypothetical protein